MNAGELAPAAEGALDDASLVAAFEDCSLEPAQVGHREHLRLAWIYLQGALFEVAAYRFCSALRRYTASLGKADRYHETITWAYLALVNERSQDGPVHADFSAFARANPDLFKHADGALAVLYDAVTLASPAARRAFLLPRAPQAPRGHAAR